MVAIAAIVLAVLGAQAPFAAAQTTSPIPEEVAEEAPEVTVLAVDADMAWADFEAANAEWLAVMSDDITAESFMSAEFGLQSLQATNDPTPVIPASTLAYMNSFDAQGNPRVDFGQRDPKGGCPTPSEARTAARCGMSIKLQIPNNNVTEVAWVGTCGRLAVVTGGFKPADCTTSQVVFANPFLFGAAIDGMAYSDTNFWPTDAFIYASQGRSEFEVGCTRLRRITVNDGADGWPLQWATTVPAGPCMAAFANADRSDVFICSAVFWIWALPFAEGRIGVWCAPGHGVWLSQTRAPDQVIVGPAGQAQAYQL